MSTDTTVSTNFAATCWKCGQPIQYTAGVADQSHVCKRDDVLRWEGYLEGWHSGYRQAAENPADPMVMADRAEYGSGWAGVMRTGSLTVSGCKEDR
jgi:hypothetical protein